MVTSNTTASPAHPVLRAFCDGCGFRFEEGQLRQFSKFCSYCGEPLSPWILRQIASQSTQSSTTTPPSNPPTVPSQKDVSDSPENESPVRPAARQNARRRLFPESASDDEDDDLPITPAQRKGRGRSRAKPVTPAQPESLSSRGKRSAERVNYSIDNAFHKMLRPLSNQVQSSRSQKRVKIERPLTRGATPNVKPRRDSGSDDLSETSPKAFFDSTSEEDDDVYSRSDDLEDDLHRPLRSYRQRAFARRSRPFLHPPFLRSDRPTFHKSNESIIQKISEEEDIFARSLGDKITLEAFELGPPVHVPEEYQKAVRNPRSFKESRMLTVRETLHEFLPQKAGDHGILYYDRDDLPPYLKHGEFSLLKTNDLVKYDSRWLYLGQYRVIQKFHMTPTQWSNVAERVKPIKTHPYWIKKSAKKWCQANGIIRGSDAFMKALETGGWRFDCLVIRCIGFDRGFYESLVGVEKSRQIVYEEENEMIYTPLNGI